MHHHLKKNEHYNRLVGSKPGNLDLRDAVTFFWKTLQFRIKHSSTLFDKFYAHLLRYSLLCTR